MKSPRPCLDEACLIRLIDPLDPPPETLWIGFSGGLDSTVLLDLAARLKKHVCVRAIHVNHQLQPEADAWSDHCESVSRALHIPLTVLKVDARAQSGESPEEAARHARYQAFRETLGQQDGLMLAHHLDDQAETVLLQLLRGAGPEGLVGMPAASRIGPSHLLRPFLDLPRSALADYAKSRSLHWIEDPSNVNPRYRRNQIRHQVIPLLNASWPSASKTLARSGRHLAEAATYLRSREDLLAREVAEGAILDLVSLKGLPPFEQKLALRGWFRVNGLRGPSEKCLQTIERSLIGAAPDREPWLRIEGGQTIRRYRRMLCLLDPMPLPLPIDWLNPETPLRLPEGNGWLRMDPHPSAGLSLNEWNKISLRVGYRKGGERIKLDGQAIHHDLGHLCQSAGIPPWIRDRMPLVYGVKEAATQLISVAGLWNATHALASAVTSPRWIPRWDLPTGIDPIGSIGNVLSGHSPAGNDTR